MNIQTRWESGEMEMNDIEEAISYIENTKKYLQHLGEIWYADYLDDAINLLKEHDEETTFVYDEYILPTCEKCGFRPFVGYIPTLKWMKERGYMKCPHCGRSVKWG